MLIRVNTVNGALKTFRNARGPLVLLSVLVCCGPVYAAEPNSANADDNPPTQDKSDTSHTLHVDIKGVSSEVETNIRAMMSLVQALKETPNLGPGRAFYLYHKAPDEIRAAMQPYGYYDPTVKSKIERRDDGWHAEFDIDPGKLLMVRTLDFSLTGEGRDQPDLIRWTQKPALQPGAPFDQSKYANIKSGLQEQAADEGYYEAQYRESQVRVYPLASAADVALHFDTGPQYRVREIRFDEAPVREDVLRRYATLSSGDPVSSEKLLKMQQGLSDTEYFRDVQIQPRWDEANADHAVPVDVRLTPNDRTSYRFGVGYGTDTGARLQALQHRRWVNDYGHKLDNIVRLSQVDNLLLSRYLIPGDDPLTDNYELRASYQDEDNDTYDTRKWRFGGEEQRVIGDNNWSWGLWLEQENYDIGDESESSTLLVPELSWSRTQSDDQLNPTQGYRLSAELSGGTESLLSETNFVQAKLTGKGVYSLTPKWRVLGRAQLGATAADDFRKIPASRRFYAGGDNSVRGYDYESLGPEDRDGDVIGGKYLMVGSLEMDYRFKEDWRVAVFTDAGNAMDSLQTPLKKSVGVGLRWQSPVGPMRIDLAKPVNDDGLRIHFSLGPDL